MKQSKNTIKDPHHNGFSEWCYIGNNFYIRTGSKGKWTRVKRTHITSKRVIALYSLIMKDRMYGGKIMTVRNNLMTQEGYSPYCGNMNGKCSMPRTEFNGKQFVCNECGWESQFPEDFIKEYKSKWKKPGSIDLPYDMLYSGGSSSQGR